MPLVEDELMLRIGTVVRLRTITPRLLDFRGVPPVPPRELTRSKAGKAKSLSPKQIRARARRLKYKGKAPVNELALLYKPVEEWDNEELARGRPRTKNGTFKGPAPKWLTRQLHEEVINRWRQIVRGEMNGLTVGALKVLQNILDNEEVDNRGKPVIAAATKADVAKWLVEHVIGKPTQRIEGDISVKLQGVLAASVVVPGTLPAQTEGVEEKQLQYVKAYASGQRQLDAGAADAADDEYEDAEMVGEEFERVG